MICFDYINALRIIEPQVERLAFIGERERVAYIKLTHQQTPIPLKSMGDGLNRVLTIILALVNADNGYLLIDEFENGLHYSVQETLWKMIFMVANKLNVQVFATTHSEDCIFSFENAMNKYDFTHQGRLIRLNSGLNSQVQAVEFDAQELSIAKHNHIEIR